MDYEEDSLLTQSLSSLIKESGMNDQVSLKDFNAKNSVSSNDSPTINQRKRLLDIGKTNLNDSLTSNKIHIKEANSTPTTHSPSISGSLITINDSILKNRYSDSNHGPFDIHVQRISNPSAPLHPITIGRLFNKLKIEGIIEIKKAGYSKVSVFLQTGKFANSLTEDSRLYENDLVAFIPPFRISRKGIIRNVPLELTEEQIMEGIKSPIKILAIRRLNRRIINHLRPATDQQTTNAHSSFEDTLTSPSYSVEITFEGQKLPTYATLYYVNHPITPYVSRVSMCHACYRFGHIKASCKGSPRCFHCGEKGHVANKDDCPHWQKPSICANCKGDHRVTDPNCPELQIQKDIREYAAYRNISIADANYVVRGKRLPPPFSSSSDEFPSLPSRSSHPFSYNKIADNLPSSRLSTRTYAQAASRASSDNHSAPVLIKSNSLPILTYKHQKFCYNNLTSQSLFSRPGSGTSSSSPSVSFSLPLHKSHSGTSHTKSTNSNNNNNMENLSQSPLNNANSIRTSFDANFYNLIKKFSKSIMTPDIPVEFIEKATLFIEGFLKSLDSTTPSLQVDESSTA